MGVDLDDLREVGGENGTVIDNRVSCELGLLSLPFKNPFGRKAKYRLPSWRAERPFHPLRGFHREKMPLHEFSLRQLVSLDENGITRGGKLEVIPDVNRGKDDSHIEGELFPHGTNPPQKLPILLGIHQGDETIAHFESQRVEQWKALKSLGFLMDLCLCLGSLLPFPLAPAPDHHQSDRTREERDHEKWQLGQAWNQSKEEDDDCRDGNRPRLNKDLADDCIPQMDVLGSTSHDNACSSGNNERRNL